MPAILHSVRLDGRQTIRLQLATVVERLDQRASTDGVNQRAHHDLPTAGT
jgi:hypothetical protein